MDSGVNWAQALVTVAGVGIILLLVALFMVLKIDAIHQRTKREMIQAQQSFLRSEYTRLAGESVIYQDELRGVIGEVHGMALALKDVISSGGWDPDKHLESLSLLDAGMARVHAFPPPSPFGNTD